MTPRRRARSLSEVVRTRNPETGHVEFTAIDSIDVVGKASTFSV